MKLPLIKGTKVSSRAEWRDFLPLNMVGFSQNIGDWSGFLRTADGLTQYTTGLGQDRGAIWSDRFKIHLRVSGNSLIEVDQFGGVIDRSTVPVAASGQARMDNSFNSVAFVADGDYYRYVPGTTTLSIVTKPVGAGDFIDIVQIDGFYFFTDGENIWNTTLADEAVFNPNERAGSDFAPDEILGLGKSTDNKLLAFNRYTTDRFYNNGGTVFPFARLPNAAIPIGIVGTDAKASIGDGRWFIFGGGKEYSPSFFILSNSYKNVSTKEIDSIIDEYSDYELVNISIEYRDTRDQALVICHLPRHTLVYDVRLSEKLGESIWYQWSSGGLTWRGINGIYDPRNLNNSASGWIYGDKQDARIGRLDPSVCTQYGDIIDWQCETPMVKAMGTVPVAELVTAPGHGAVTGDVVFVSTSKDGALYGPEVMVLRGDKGDYQHRMIVRRLGDYPQWFSMRVRGKSAGVFSVAGVEVNEV